MTETDRRAMIVAERIRQTGIDQAMIDRLVATFYGRIRSHAVLGPIFNARIDDWDEHMSRLCAFWSSVVHGSGAYSGSPMQKHLPLPIDGRHFDLWLALFAQTARETCPATAADLFIDRAHRIAESLETAIAGGQGTILFKGERLQRAELDASLAAAASANEPSHH
jgi:hemoglobin